MKDLNELLEKMRNARSDILEKIDDEREISKETALELIDFLEMFDSLDIAIQEEQCLPDDWDVR